MENFGKNLQYFRRLKGYSQSDFALALGYQSRDSIAKIEAGKRNMNQNQIWKASQLLGVSPSAFFVRDDGIVSNVEKHYRERELDYAIEDARLQSYIRDLSFDDKEYEKIAIDFLNSQDNDVASNDTWECVINKHQRQSEV